jgi:hypothetical protein
MISITYKIFSFLRDKVIKCLSSIACKSTIESKKEKKPHQHNKVDIENPIGYALLE